MGRKRQTPAIPVTALSWQYSAACHGRALDLFFPLGRAGTDAGLEQAGEARAVCGRCPVERECLEYALTTPEPYGVWGGTTEEERKYMRKRAARGRAA